MDLKGEPYGPTICQCAFASIQAPSQWSRESGQQEHLSDLSPINDPIRADETFSDVASQWKYGLVWNEQEIVLVEGAENEEVNLDVSVTKLDAKSWQAEIIA